MPLYEYGCEDCGERFEILQSTNAGTEGLACPACDSTRLRKVVSTFAASTGASQGAGASNCATGFT